MVWGSNLISEGKYLHLKIANVDHNIYKMLDFEGFPCNDEHTYHLSDCILDDFEKKTMQKVGCTTPFGKIKDNICKDDYKGIYHRLLTSFNMPISYLLH